MIVVKRKERMVSVPVRLPPNVRAQAKSVAASNGITESAVYRAIIENFFSSECQLKVDVLTTEKEKSDEVPQIQ